MKFYLGTHIPHWLYSDDFKDTPLFLSRTTIGQRKKLKPAVTDWALDSGAFSELTLHGRWTITPRQYADECLRLRDGAGRMDFCSIQDWMCEDVIIKGGAVAGRKAPGTGLSVAEHQRRTVENYCILTAMEPDLPWLPVLQGYTDEEYHDCYAQYLRAGVDLRGRWVGVGSVCKRQATDSIAAVFRSLHPYGMKLHGFGVKAAGIEKSAQYLHSADSLAWSFGARRGKIKAAECVAAGAKHRNCANCSVYAKQWLERLVQPAIAKGLCGPPPPTSGAS